MNAYSSAKEKKDRFCAAEPDDTPYDNDCLLDIPFLADLPSDQQDEILSRAIRRRLRKGSILFREGDPATSLYIICRGKIKLTRSDAGGNEQIVGIFSDKELIWEGVLLEGSTFPYSAVSMTTCWVWILSSAQLQSIFRDPKVSVRVMTILSGKLHDANERNLILATKDPLVRLASFLLYRQKRDLEDGLTLKLSDIAASLNLRPETVSRKIAQLSGMGYIARDGRSRLKIIDFEGLEELIR